MNDAEIRIEYMPLTTVLGAPKNPKGHDLELLNKSLERFDFVEPLVINETTGRLVAGHGRLETLRKRKAAGETPPGRIVSRDGEWFVPIVRGVAFATDDEAQAYLVASNQTVTAGGWDDTALAAMLQDISAAPNGLAGVGYTDESLQKLLRDIDRASGTPKPEVPDPRIEEMEKLIAKWQTAPGQLWGIDQHRIMVGDCTTTDVVRLLGDPAVADAIVMDPPYCSGGFQEASRSAGSVGTQAAHKKVANDTLSTRGYIALLKSTLKAIDAGVAYAFTDWRMWVNLFDVMESSGFGVRNMIVWDKGTPGMGAGWRSQHELIMFGTHTAHKFDDHDAVGNVIQASRTGNHLHTTQKPVDLLSKIISVTRFAKTIYDPFCGSGSTLIAAHQCGRIGYGMELDHGYVAITLERFAELGVKPTLLP